jgi:excisionase family DNA binding protein
VGSPAKRSRVFFVIAQAEEVGMNVVGKARTAGTVVQRKGAGTRQGAFPPVLTLQEVCNIFGVSEMAIRNRIKKGKLPAPVYGGGHGRQFLFLEEEIRRHIEVE